MALTKYTNVDEINARTTGTGQFLNKEDLFVISQDSAELSDFGSCSSDIMEITLYDLNGNILPQIENNITKDVRYIKNVADYYLKTNTNEFAINVEKILNESNYKNGIIRVNVNFVRLKVGDETKYRKMWIQEISSTRGEIRTLPLNVQDDEYITNINKIEFQNFQELNVDELTYKKYLESVNDITTEYLIDKCKEYITGSFSKLQNPYEEFTNIMYNDFNVKIRSTATDSFEKFVTDVFNTYKEKVNKKSTELTSECNVVSRTMLNQELLNYLIESYNEKSNILGVRELIVDVNTTNSQEQIAEDTFETANDINTTAVSTNVDEYSTIDLSNINVKVSGLDDFQLLQEKIISLLNNDTQNTSTDETTNQTTKQTTKNPAVVNVPIQLGYSAASIREACFLANQEMEFNTYYIDKATLQTGASIKNDVGQIAPLGYYSDGTLVANFTDSSGKIISVRNCAS